MRLRDAVSPTRAIRNLLSSQPESDADGIVVEHVENVGTGSNTKTELDSGSEGSGVETVTPSTAGMDEALMSGAVHGELGRADLVVDESQALVKDKRNGVPEQRLSDANIQNIDGPGEQDGHVGIMASKKRILKEMFEQTSEEKRAFLNKELDLKPLTRQDAYKGAAEAFNRAKKSTSPSTSATTTSAQSQTKDFPTSPASPSRPLSPSGVSGTAATTWGGNNGGGSARGESMVEEYKANVRKHRRRSAVVVGEEERRKAVSGE